MGKKPGLPDGSLELDVDEGAFGEPASVPDYLDRAFGATAAAPERERATASAKPPQAKRLQPVAAPAKKRAEPESSPARRDGKVVEIERSRERSPERRGPLRRAERKELSIDAETSRMIDRVVGDLRESTPQKDATASEFARAIIQLAEESRHHQDFTHVGRRGQWGSPTARAFVADLKEGFLQAIGRHFIDRYPKEAAALLRQVLGDGENNES
jgi:hypothetical protein